MGLNLAMRLQFTLFHKVEYDSKWSLSRREEEIDLTDVTCINFPKENYLRLKIRRIIKLGAVRISNHFVPYAFY